MKKIVFSIISAVLFVGVFTSCDDELEQLPFNQLTSDIAYETAEDFENAIRGVYLGLTSGSYYGSADGGSLMSAPDVLADNVIITGDGRGTKRTLFEHNYDAGNITTGLYIAPFQVIYRSNVILEQLVENDFQGSNRNQIEAEALALRAMAHFDMVRFYGQIPTQSGGANGSLGVPYLTEPDPLVVPSRLTVGDTYQRIVEDLTIAESMIGTTPVESRLNKESVNLLLSRVYLYMGEWQRAIDAADRVTTPIAPAGSVEAVWQDESPAGVVFSISNAQGAGNLNSSVGVSWSQGPVTGIVPEYAVAYDFYNMFDDDDVRKEAYIFTGTHSSGNQYNCIRKLLGKSGAFNGVVDIKIFRAEEALLNKAEAQFELGQTAQALITLNQLRDQRYPAYAGGETGNALRDAIRHERRLEFAFEYQRFFDLKRWGLPVVRGNHGDRIDGSGQPPTSLTLDAGSHRWQLPFGASALRNNPNLTQNPGYGG